MRPLLLCFSNMKGHLQQDFCRDWVTKRAAKKKWNFIILWYLNWEKFKFSSDFDFGQKFFFLSNTDHNVSAEGEQWKWNRELWAYLSVISSILYQRRWFWEIAGEQEFHSEIWKSYINKYEEEKIWKMERSHQGGLATIMDVKLLSERYSLYWKWIMLIQLEGEITRNNNFCNKRYFNWMVYIRHFKSHFRAIYFQKT